MKKALIGLLVLAGLGGTGFGVWWFFIDAEPRNLRALNGHQDDEKADAWSWMASHGDRPAVRKAMGEELHSLLNDASVGGRPTEWQEKRLAGLNGVFTAYPLTEPELASQAMTAWARFEYAPALQWAKDPGIVTRGLVAALEELPRAFRSSEHVNLPLAHGETARLLAELEQRGVKADSEQLVRSVVQCWLRFRAPAARPAFESARTAHPRRFEAALIDRVIHGTDYRALTPDEEETELLVRELGALKPELTRDLLQAIARLADRKATPRLLQAWGPSSIDAMRAARDSFESYAQTEADALLARLGSVEPGAVKRKVESLYAYASGDPVMRAWDRNEPLVLVMSCSHDFAPRVKDVVPHLIDELAQMPSAALRDAWEGTEDLLTLHLVSRALVKADAEALTTALEPRWTEFAPVARAAERGKLRADRLDEATAFNYRHQAPRFWEGLSALQEAEKPGAAALRHLWPAVSSPSHQLSQTAVAIMDKHLADDEFVLGLFAYFDLRTSYSVDEVNGWVELMSKRQKSHRLLGKLMGRLLDAVGGKPEAIPMVHKVVGLSALSKSTCECGAVLQRFAADSDSYERVQFKEDRSGKESDRTSTTQRFADLAKAALAR